MKTLNALCISNRVYTLFIKTFLLFRISLLKCFIYRRVKTVYILNGTKIPFTLVQKFLSGLPRIRSRQYLFTSSRKSSLPLKLSTACPQEKSSRPQEKSSLPNWFRIFHILLEEMLSPLAYVMSGFSSINDCFQIPTFLIDEHSSR